MEGTITRRRAWFRQWLLVGLLFCTAPALMGQLQCTPGLSRWPGALNQLGLSTDFIDGPDGIFACFTGVARPYSADSQAARVPEAVVEIGRGIGTTLARTAQQMEELFGTAFNKQVFPCGVNGEFGYTVCPNNPPDIEDGDWVVVGMEVEQFIPLNDPVNHYTFAFVFDSDSDPANDWVALPAFPNDYYQGTDFWIQVRYTPGSGWSMDVQRVTDAENNVAEPVQSAAIGIISDDGVTVMVPENEFASATPGYRLNTFRHTGDFGANPPFNWSADFHPELDELFSLDLAR